MDGVSRERVMQMIARRMTDDIFDEDFPLDAAWWWIYNAICYGVGPCPLNSLSDDELNHKLEDWSEEV